MPAEEYHADPCPIPSYSNSIGKLLAERTPAHAWISHPRLNPAFEPEEKASFDLGSAGHALLLEGADRMQVVNADSYRSKMAQELRDAARAIGKHPILAQDYDDVYRMVEVAKQAIDNCQDFDPADWHNGTAEPVLIWREGPTWCRVRADKISPSRKLIFDYKSTATSANPLEWERTMLNGWGDMQPAFYLRGNAALGGPEDAKFIWLVQEVKPPFAACFIGVAPALLDLGQQKCVMAMATWAECMKSKQWPAYSNRVHWISPPEWARAKWDARAYGPTDADGLPDTSFLRKDDGTAHPEILSQG